MSKTSSVVTGSATVAAAALAPAIEWLANIRLQLAMPPQVVLIVAAALVTAGHLAVNLVGAWMLNRNAPSKIPAPVMQNNQVGRACIGSMLWLAIMAIVASSMLGGCSILSASIGQYEKDAGQIIVQSAERTVCKDIPIGIWLDTYGSSPTRLAGWQALCGNPIQNPLDPATVATILKVYPDFKQAAIDAVPVAQLPVAQQPAWTPLIAPASAPIQAKAVRRPRPVTAPAQPVTPPAVTPVPAPVPSAPAKTSLLSPAVKP